jgi:hypothetical protein
MSLMDEPLGQVGRMELMEMIYQLRADLVQARLDVETADVRARTALIIEGCLTCVGGAEYKAMLANLTDTQRRCTELITETREMKAGWPMPGWTCINPACGLFNGSMKELRTHCRGCDAPRPT